ncbi:alpha/beta fold hydrolase [Brachybacterium sacelli]|uniref:Pimeloyl-ACP methyl ester carboxylesterase n=1 Tax=Brachybacterium sacelli TaxID=173364 RepID=A0ABS4WZK6_9MICO|nr:alpha/beta fold hydrolase [Brachybacterium sacelli]MBP2381625.1 pimeloyl-ACP methyl ester carboxylesterase [Brachybacterium sacelli]
MTHTPWTLPGLHLDDITLPVPLDHSDPASPRLEVFARIVSAPGGEHLPFLVYLQGGPGAEAPRPLDASSPGWLARALREHRVVMLDQRGTGRSTPVGLDAPLPAGAVDGASTLREATPAQQAAYLTHFRADAIARDAELLREHLGVATWSLLGQSFGGFTALRYLSAHADSVDKALFTGGLPTLGPGMDAVYTTTWHGMIARSEQHWSRFPADRDRMRRLADLAADGRLRLADGQRVGVERLRRLGHLLGASQGAERLHYLLDLHPAAPAFAHDLAAALPFSGRNPLYAVIHESCWADGTATHWAGDRTMPQAVHEDPTLLAGEHIHRDLFAEDPELAPWAEAADLLAAHHWPPLYDEESLRAADVPGAAAVYFDDAYVPREYSLATADLLSGVTPWVTSEYEHNGLRASGERVLDHLLDLATGRRAA